jgi:hypothetical protein
MYAVVHPFHGHKGTYHNGESEWYVTGDVVRMRVKGNDFMGENYIYHHPTAQAVIRDANNQLLGNGQAAGALIVRETIGVFGDSEVWKLTLTDKGIPRPVEFQMPEDSEEEWEAVSEKEKAVVDIRAKFVARYSNKPRTEQVWEALRSDMAVEIAQSQYRKFNFSDTEIFEINTSIFQNPIDLEVIEEVDKKELAWSGDEEVFSLKEELYRIFWGRSKKAEDQYALTNRRAYYSRNTWATIFMCTVIVSWLLLKILEWRIPSMFFWNWGGVNAINEELFATGYTEPVTGWMMCWDLLTWVVGVIYAHLFSPFECLTALLQGFDNSLMAIMLTLVWHPIAVIWVGVQLLSFFLCLLRIRSTYRYLLGYDSNRCLIFRVLWTFIFEYFMFDVQDRIQYLAADQSLIDLFGNLFPVWNRYYRARLIETMGSYSECFHTVYRRLGGAKREWDVDWRVYAPHLLPAGGVFQYTVKQVCGEGYFFMDMIGGWINSILVWSVACPNGA